jgi:NAD(P)-dependent dehydrogenase (short-subunit alcohol dehydrogenase family)
VVLITGASSGIGEAAVRRVFRAGWHVAFAARRAGRIQALQRELDPEGGRTLVLPGDVTSPNDREQWVRTVLHRWGHVDALVNNAGYGQRGPVELVALERIRANFETNLFAGVALAQLLLPHMRERGRGRIVNVGSVAGRIARPFSSVYDATKHALNAISDGMRLELRPFGIDVVVIEPGFIETEFIEAADRASERFMADPGVYAGAWAALERSFERVRRVAGRPDDIARLIERALNVRRPRSRYAGPFHARVFLVARRLLPDRVFDRILRVRV